MNTERTEKFVNAIACDLEEGGFRQVSGTTLRRTLATAVSAALPLLAGQQGAELPQLPEPRDMGYTTDSVMRTYTMTGYTAEQMQDYARAALAATGKQQVGDFSWLRSRISSMPVRYERLGGQQEAYIQKDGVLGWLDEAERRSSASNHCVDKIEQLPVDSNSQQVGEVQGDARAQFEAWAHAQSYRGGNIITDRDADHPDVYACPNAQLTWQCWKAALAARQPVGEPAAWMTHHDQPMLYPTFAEAAAYCDDDEPPIPLYAAPPAPGIDLGEFRIERAVKLLDLIDRLRDAAPGVGNG